MFYATFTGKEILERLLNIRGDGNFNQFETVHLSGRKPLVIGVRESSDRMTDLALDKYGSFDDLSFGNLKGIKAVLYLIRSYSMAMEGFTVRLKLEEVVFQSLDDLTDQNLLRFFSPLDNGQYKLTINRGALRVSSKDELAYELAGRADFEKTMSLYNRITVDINEELGKHDNENGFLEFLDRNLKLGEGGSSKSKAS